MPLRNATTLALICALWVSFSAFPAGDWSDSGITGPSYSKILSEMKRWHETYPGLTELVDFGKSVRGLPLRMMIARKPGRFSDRPTLILSGSTHGDEYLHLEDRLPEALLQQSRQTGSIQRFFDRGGAFVFIPIMNPDGYEARTRENAEGVDLNRDWDWDLAPAGFKGFTQIESQALRRQLERMELPPYRLHYQISVDYHCCAGALLYPWAYQAKHIPEADFSRHLAIAQMASELLNIDYGATGEVLGYFPLGTTKDYYYDHYGMLAFTYEGRYGVEDSYFSKHLEWWKKMVGYLNQEQLATFFPLFPERSHHAFSKLAD